MSEQDNIKEFSNIDVPFFELGSLIGSLAAFALFAWAGMWLWNACLVAVFPGIPEVSYFQFCGLYILCNILFKHKRTSTNDKK